MSVLSYSYSDINTLLEMYQSFKKYMTYKKDFNELLLHLLRGLVKDAVRFEELMRRSNTPLTQIQVKVEDLEAKVKRDQSERMICIDLNIIL